MYTQKIYQQDQEYMHWTLDYSRLSDADDLISLLASGTNSEQSSLIEVDYATDMKLSGVPDFLAFPISQRILINGTKWVKEAEK